MQNTNNPAEPQDVLPEEHVKEVMGPTPEESKPVSVPNESALEAAPTGAVISPQTEAEKHETEVPPEEPQVQEKPKEDYRNWHEKLKHNLRRWWKDPKKRWGTIIGVVALFFFLVLFPTTRYFILNNVGVRSSASFMVYDESTRQPLKNVQVTLRGQTITTGSDGKVTMKHLKLGKTKLQLQRRAFADVSKNITLGWGSNPLGNLELKPVGLQYAFVLTDFLTGKPIKEAEVNSGELAAISDEKGKAVLTVDAGNEDDLTAEIVSKGYRVEKVEVGPDTKEEQKIQMVSSRKQPFVSKRNGKFDLYKVDIDGKNEELMLKATGNEEEQISLVSHPTDELVTMVSTRENVRNKDGFLLNTLIIVNLKDNSFRTVAQAERIQVMGWIGSRVVYAQIGAGASGLNPNRQRLWAYDYSSQKTQELASSNAFNDAAVVGKDVYYGPSSALSAGAKTNLHKISADASNKEILLDKEVWNIFRADYETMYFAAQNEWYQYKIGANSKPTKQTNPPANLKHRIYADSPNGKQSIWQDERDGKGTLVAYDVETKKEQVIKQQPGLAGPIRWLDDRTIIYHIQTPQETASYVMSLDGGEAKKISDVTRTSGIERWYYY